MSQISLRDAAGLVEKLLSERVPVRAFFISAFGTRILLPGFVSSATVEKGLFISAPDGSIERGFLNTRAFNRDCDFAYGDQRELPPEIRDLAETRGESCLLMFFRDSMERLALFFTL